MFALIFLVDGFAVADVITIYKHIDVMMATVYVCVSLKRHVEYQLDWKLPRKSQSKRLGL